MNPTGISSQVLCHGPVLRLVPWPCLVPLEGHPGIRQLPGPCGNETTGSPKLGCQWPLPGPPVPSSSRAGGGWAPVSCHFPGQLKRGVCAREVPTSALGAPLALESGQGKGGQTPAGTAWCPPFLRAARTLDSLPFPVGLSFLNGVFRALEAGWEGKAPAQAVPSFPP